MTDADPGRPVLRAEDLRVERGGRTVLDGASLAVAPGERVLIRGDSGAGKTTLFEALGLLLPPTDGSLYVGDADAAALSLPRDGGDCDVTDAPTALGARPSGVRG